jgi:hypothetical protein
MNEAELIAGTIESVKTQGWTTSYLFEVDTGRHCILGAIGYARWGDQWDIDCREFNEGEEMYQRLAEDSLTHSLIKKISKVIIAKSPQYGGRHPGSTSPYEDEYLNCLLYGWNDDLSHVDDGDEVVMEVLEKTQAEIGIETEEASDD